MSHRHFEGVAHSQIYAIFRPVPPPSLVKAIQDFYLKGNPVNKKFATALDVGCGSGQSTFVLQDVADKVVGSDVSPAQVKEANKEAERRSVDNVHFSVGTGETLETNSSSVDLVTTCQAAHWIDLNLFYAEVDRVLSPGGVVAVYGYSFTGPGRDVRCWEEVKARREQFYEETKPYWDAKRVLVDEQYKTILQIPYDDKTRDDSHYTQTRGTLADLQGYLGTWSGVQAMRRALGDEKVDKDIELFADDVKSIMGVSASTPAKDVSMDLRTDYFLLMGRKPTK